MNALKDSIKETLADVNQNSLSMADIAPVAEKYGDLHISGKDVRLEEDIAPVRSDLATQSRATEDIAPIGEDLAQGREPASAEESNVQPEETPTQKATAKLPAFFKLLKSLKNAPY